MFALLQWTLWALAVSPSMAEEATLKPVEWVDLMFATAKFPRFFGAPPYIARTDPPKITGMSQNHNEKNHKPPLGKIAPLHCFSDQKTGNFSCPGYTDCDVCRGAAKDHGMPAFSALQESRTSLGAELDGLSFNSDYVLIINLRDVGYDRYDFYFSQNMDGLLPIDNTLVVIGLNEWEDGTTSLAPEEDRSMVYEGEFDHGSGNATCNKHLARDTAARVAFSQPFWDALSVPDYQKVYTVQDGRLYLTWRLRFNLTRQVGDDFYVWVNARNCSQVIAAAPEKMDSYTRSLAHFQDEQRRLFEERGLPWGETLLN